MAEHIFLHHDGPELVSPSGWISSIFAPEARRYSIASDISLSIGGIQNSQIAFQSYVSCAMRVIFQFNMLPTSAEPPTDREKILLGRYAMTRIQSCPIVLLGLAGLFMLMGPAVARQSSAVPRPLQPVFLEFLNSPPVGAPLTEVPRLMLGIGGAFYPAVVDTGSTGLVISATSIPDLDTLPSTGPGTITYSSSGRIMRGRWVVTPVVIGGKTGRAETRPIAVLAVDAISCTATARHCTPIQNPRGVSMLGIGFGREHDLQPDATPDHNPLLNLVTGGRAFIITHRGIRLNADRTNFAFVRLERDNTDGDWSAPSACLALGDRGTACGTVLVDTGITGMFLTVPPTDLPVGVTGDGPIPDGTAVRIDLMPARRGKASIGYVVHVGDGNDAGAPTSAVLVRVGRRAPFINTGVHLLNRFDYLYDADAGLVGYKPDEVRPSEKAR
jgi:predicted aspartyl protease